jgi:hypothetical protein
MNIVHASILIMEASREAEQIYVTWNEAIWMHSMSPSYIYVYMYGADVRVMAMPTNSHVNTPGLEILQQI